MYILSYRIIEQNRLRKLGQKKKFQMSFELEFKNEKQNLII